MAKTSERVEIKLPPLGWVVGWLSEQTSDGAKGGLKAVKPDELDSLLATFRKGAVHKNGLTAEEAEQGIEAFLNGYAKKDKAGRYFLNRNWLRF